MAVLSVVSWIVVEGLFARLTPPGPTATGTGASPSRPAVAALPADWPQRLLPATRELLPGVAQAQAAAVFPIAKRHAGRFQLDPLLVLAVIQVESRFDPAAVSDQGAVGLMQLQAPTARALAADLGMEWTSDDLLRDPDVNVYLGCAYLRQLLDRFGDRDAALAAYESGPTYVEARRDANGRIPLAYSDRVWDVLSALRLKLITQS